MYVYVFIYKRVKNMRTQFKNPKSCILKNIWCAPAITKTQTHENLFCIFFFYYKISVFFFFVCSIYFLYLPNILMYTTLVYCFYFCFCCYFWWICNIVLSQSGLKFICKFLVGRGGLTCVESIKIVNRI